MIKLPRKPCPICSKEPKRPDTKFCSIKCRAEFQKGKRFGGPKIKHLPKPCPQCKNIFKPYRGSQIFCSQSCSGKANIQECISKGFTSKGLKRSKAQRKLISDRAKQLYQGKNNPNYGNKAAHGKGTWHLTWEKKKVWLRSSWELKYAIYLDAKKIKYEVEHKTFEIKYRYNNKLKEGTYTPDFFLIESNKFIEIKGWWRDDAKSKYKAFKNKYRNINLEVLDKKKLLTLGIDL